MSCLGVLFSIDQTTVEFIEQLPTEEKRVDYIKEVIEEDYFQNQPQWVAELGKSWDALHRSLTDGELAWTNGEYPLNHVIFGGELLCANGDYIIVLKSKEQVTEIAEAVNQLTKRSLRARYFLLDSEEYDGEVGEEDFEYTWQWFEDSKVFWQKAADEGRSVLFTVDQ
jgi:hypothetical protein